MSRFFKIPDAAFNPCSLHREVLTYVIEEFRGDAENLEYPGGQDAEKFMQCLINISDHKFRMYGSAQELLENVKIFKSFPESHYILSVSFAPYNVSPTIFYSLKNEKFICKSDLFVILQNMIFDDTGNKNFIASIAGLLKNGEAQLDRLEFVRFSEEVLEEIKNEIDSVMKIEPTNESKDYVRKFLSGDDDSTGLTASQLRAYLGMLKLNDDPHAMELGLKTDQWSEAIQRVYKAYPEMFRPHASVPNNPMPITLRVFEDGDQRFVLTRELANALMALGDTRAPVHCRMLETMTLDDVQKTFETKSIEFIRYPIVRTKHRMVPVVLCVPPEMKRCVLALDGFFELLREAIFSLKMFQSPMATPDLVFQMLGLCSLDKKPYFLPNDGLVKLRDLWRSAQEDVTKAAVRNAKKDGFTVQNLKNELEHLGLTTTFPEIQDYAEVVYSEVDKIKKGDVLRTCDLYDAVEHCQLNCIINHYFLKEFLHDQRGCSRVLGYKCELCESEASNSEVSHRNREKNKKKKDKKKAKLAQKKSGVSEDAETAAEFQMNDETSSELATGSQKTSEVIIERSEIGQDGKTGSDYSSAKAELLKTSDAVAPDYKASSETQC